MEEKSFPSNFFFLKGRIEKVKGRRLQSVIHIQNMALPSKGRRRKEKIRKEEPFRSLASQSYYGGIIPVLSTLYFLWEAFQERMESTDEGKGLDPFDGKMERGKEEGHSDNL